MFNINAARAVKAVYVRRSGQDYDLRYAENAGNFYVANHFWKEHNLDTTHGLVVVRDDQNNVAFQIVPDTEATYIAARYTTDDDGNKVKMGKGKFFTGSVLRPMLDKAGLEGVTRFSLDQVGDSDFYQINELEGSDSDSAMDDEDDELEMDAEEATTETTGDLEDLVTADEEESDPFDV
jgi:hypothetical protein